MTSFKDMYNYPKWLKLNVINHKSLKEIIDHNIKKNVYVSTEKAINIITNFREKN